MNNIINLKGATSAPRSQSSRMETLIVTLDQVQKWQKPRFQRDKRVNKKVLEIADKLRNGEVMLSGSITPGRLPRDPTLYIVDGQHRLEAFKISGLDEIIIDLRIIECDTWGEMADEYVKLNTPLARMQPDDILRGLEETSPVISAIRREAPFVGYGSVRRSASGSGAILSMSAMLRCWWGSSGETPTGNTSGVSAAQLAESMDMDSTHQLLRFLNCAHEAWGRVGIAVVRYAQNAVDAERPVDLDNHLYPCWRRLMFGYLVLLGLCSIAGAIILLLGLEGLLATLLLLVGAVIIGGAIANEQ